MKTMGVYAIRQQSTGISYIGSSVNISFRWKRHISDLKCGRHHAHWLQRAWTKHGEADFVFEVMEHVADIEQLRTQEALWLSKSNKNFNNQQPSNRSGVLQHGMETKAKMSAAQKARFQAQRKESGGRILSKAHIALMVQRRRETVGWAPSDETRKSMSIAAKKKPPVTDATREKLRQANFKRTYPPMSDEQKEKLRIAHTGKTLSPEHRLNIGKSLSRFYGDGSRKERPTEPRVKAKT